MFYSWRSLEDRFSRASCNCLALNFLVRASAIICFASGESSEDEAGEAGSMSDRLREGVMGTCMVALFPAS